MSEFRQDPVSGDWIVMAPERSLRPSNFSKKKEARVKAPRSTCPFEATQLETSPVWPPIISFPKLSNWRIVIVPNRFPALNHSGGLSKSLNIGPYHFQTGVGHHDLVVTRDHDKNFALLSRSRAIEVMTILGKRYRELSQDPGIVYTSSFFNWGPKAGASIYHPHYQILSLPIIPPDIQHSLNGSERYYKKHKKCVHCEMVKYEKRVRKRVIMESREAIVLAPFVSRVSYELRLFPKHHLPYFEQTSSKIISETSDLLRKTLRLLRDRLNDPDLNFFIHTAPLKDQNCYHHYHWHIEIVPKITVWAGFELSTGVDINTIDPDYVASFLRPKHR
jgi:UDPglucose--hexose-1-phosphate uridylyltransferase